VDVPPMKKITVKATATNGVCEVPFSYKQKDVLTNGQEVISRNSPMACTLVLKPIP
jgi:hypothetical protein